MGFVWIFFDFLIFILWVSVHMVLPWWWRVVGLRWVFAVVVGVRWRAWVCGSAWWKSGFVDRRGGGLCFWIGVEEGVGRRGGGRGKSA